MIQKNDQISKFSKNILRIFNFKTINVLLNNKNFHWLFFLALKTTET